MSEGENHHHGKNEIIIVKRHKGDHDGAHGGAWKIAYADFMTAMMAFFLVMWLVNAANEKPRLLLRAISTRSSFRMKNQPRRGWKSRWTRRKALRKTNAPTPRPKVTNGSSAATGEDLTSQTGEQANYSEADFFENPYSVLAEIAQEVGQQANVSAKGEGGAADSGPATGASGGEAYRDPFDPDFWTQQVKITRAEQQPPQQQQQSEQQTEQAEVSVAEACRECCDEHGCGRGA